MASGTGPTNAEGSAFSRWIALFTVVAVGVFAVYAPGLWRRLPILLGALAGLCAYLVLANGMGLGAPIDFSKVASAPLFGLPSFTAPVFDAKAMVLIAPVAIILVAENLGHLKGIAAMTGRSLDPYIGRAFVGDGIATMLSGSAGGTGVTTYAENMGVMAVTRIYSTLMFVAAALIAILLGFSPKFGALILTIRCRCSAASPSWCSADRRDGGAHLRREQGRLLQSAQSHHRGGGAGAGRGQLQVTLAGFTLDGIGTATFGAIILYHLLKDPSRRRKHPFDGRFGGRGERSPRPFC